MAYEDLLKDTSQYVEDGDYFLLTITDLNPGQSYPLQFRWKKKDGTYDVWSAVKIINPPNLGVPNEPALSEADVVGGAGFIKVTWNGLTNGTTPLNLDRVDIHISGTTFGDGTKPAGSFKTAGTQTFAAVAGTYIVQLKLITTNNTESIYSQGYSVNVTDVGEPVQTPVAPSSSGFTSRRILGGIEVTWDGSYSSAWTGFSAINIYAGTSSSATSGTYIKVGQMTANKISNKIVVPVDGTYVRYDNAVYIHASSVNKNNDESSIVANVTNQSTGAASATSSDISAGAVTYTKLAAGVLTVDHLEAGDISSTSYIRAGTSGSARVELSSATVGSVNPGLYVYNSGGTAVLSAPLSGGLSITGALAATSISTSSNKFTVNSSGQLTASDVNLTGSITATGGYIGSIIISGGGMQNSGGTWDLASNGTIRLGSSPYIYLSPSLGIYDTGGKFNLALSGTSTVGGWTLSSTSLSAGSVVLGSDGYFQIGSGSSMFRADTNGIYLGNSSFASAPFSVNLSGNIYATSGTIGGFSLGSNYITTGSGSSGYRIKTDGTAVFGALTTSTATISGGLTLSSGTSTVSAGGNDFNNVGNLSTTSGNISTVTGSITAGGELYAAGHQTVGNTPQAYVYQTGGRIARYVSSSRRYKENIVDLKDVPELDPKKLLDFKVRAFSYKEDYLKNDDRSGVLVPGLIAEEVEDIYPLAVDYADGQVENINDRTILINLLALVQDLNKRLDALEG